MEIYDHYRIDVPPTAPEDLNDILVALLDSRGFDSFGEDERGLDAFALRTLREECTAAVEELRDKFGFTYERTEQEDMNWNAVWEANFQPVRVGEWAGLRAGFHPPFGESVAHELVIDPKMAFGTGHHATTWMMLDLMQDYDFAGRSVFDYGCGTGVLAILAAKLGAGPVWAVDVEVESYLNTRENAELNGQTVDGLFHGTLADVPPLRGGWAYILANINRNVILESFTSLQRSLQTGGKLFISGILDGADAALIETASAANGLRTLQSRERDGWRAWVVVKD